MIFGSFPELNCGVVTAALLLTTSVDALEHLLDC